MANIKADTKIESKVLQQDFQKLSNKVNDSNSKIVMLHFNNCGDGAWEWDLKTNSIKRGIQADFTFTRDVYNEGRGNHLLINSKGSSDLLKALVMIGEAIPNFDYDIQFLTQETIKLIEEKAPKDYIVQKLQFGQGGYRILAEYFKVRCSLSRQVLYMTPIYRRNYLQGPVIAYQIGLDSPYIYQFSQEKGQFLIKGSVQKPIDGIRCPGNALMRFIYKRLADQDWNQINYETNRAHAYIQFELKGFQKTFYDMNKDQLKHNISLPCDKIVLIKGIKLINTNRVWEWENDPRVRENTNQQRFTITKEDSNGTIIKTNKFA